VKPPVSPYRLEFSYRVHEIKTSPKTGLRNVYILAQLQVLQGIECDIVQGFFFSRPVPAKALPEIVRDGFPGVAAKGQENHDVVAAETPTSGAGSRTPSS